MSRQVTVFGANGKVGRLIVHELLARQYDVVAFVHDDHSFESHDHLSIIQGDIYRADDVTKAIEGSKVVLSALGSWGTPKKDILEVGMGYILSSAQTQGVQTIISLTGADARAKGDRLSLVHRLSHGMISLLAGKILYDGEKHIRLLEESSIDYTVIRSPVMSSEEQLQKSYTLTDKRPLPWQTINRQLVVFAMVDAVEDRTWQRKSPFLS